MIRDWVLLLVALLYVGLLFAVAYIGDRRPGLLRSPRMRALVYSLTLVVYCSSWTFYGAVGTAARNGLAYLPIYLGPALLFLFGTGFLRRLLQVVRRRKITSIADFIGARFGKSRRLAALVTVIAVVAVVPYIALQFKAVATSLGVLGLDGNTPGGSGIDTGLWCAVLLAAFAILFGTRNIDATQHHHGLVLAVALESLIKLTVFVAVAVYAFDHGPGLAATLQRPLHELHQGLPHEFIAQTMLAVLAMFCLPRQFQVGILECDDEANLRHARWLLPLFMAIVSLGVLPIVAAGASTPQVAGSSAADTWMLTLPMAHGSTGMALLAFIGGFSAATGMVIVGSVALSVMLSNDLVMPALLRVRGWRLNQREDLSGVVIAVRGASIILIALLAYAYYRSATSAATLAAIGLLAFAAVAQFAPAMLAALYWRGASRRGVMFGLAGGFAVWLYTLLLPTLIHSGDWLQHGPFGWTWLRPQALFYLSGWGPLMHGLFWSLLVNAGCLVLMSLRFPPSLAERLDSAAFLGTDADATTGVGDWRGRVTVADLRTIAEHIVGDRGAAHAFDDYAREHQTTLQPAEHADRTLVRFTERLLASAVGAANARRILVSALSGHGLDVAEAVALLDEASHELRFNRGLLSTILGNVAQGISVIDGDMRLVAWNKRYLELFDYPDGMVRIGLPVSDLIRWNAARGECGPGDIATLVARRVEYMRAGSPHVVEHVRPDGAVIEVRGRALPTGGYVTTYSDVTSYKRTEQALVEVNATLERRVEQRTAELSTALADTALARHAAEAANASKSRFLAAASHDLLQPLNAARLFTAALRAQPGIDAETSGLAERIDASFRAADGLLSALLDVSRLDAGRYRPEISDFALAGMFDSLRAQFAVVAAQRGLRLRVVPTRLSVRSDPQLLGRIVQNLVSNALRYTAHGGVVLGARRAPQGVRIEVWDSGPGIAADQHARIFGEFQRLDSPSPWGEQGLGLGLSICQRLAGMLHHPLSLRSTVGRGSCFVVAVPRAAAPATVNAPAERRTGAQHLSLRVLCIDNEAAILEGMAALLQRWGIECRTALDAGGARRELEAGTVDVILADYHLAGDADGLRVLDDLRGQLGHLPPVVVVTADAGRDLKQRAHALGYPVLLKPVRPSALRAVLATFVHA